MDTPSQPTYRSKHYQTMLVDVSDNVGIITLNRPEAYNASNSEMSIERTEILEGLTSDPEVRVVILTGGDKVFSAGGDLVAFSRFGSSEAKAFSQRVISNQKLMADMPKPTIAAVAGYSYGGGLEQVLQCDLRIAEEGATFALPEINVGIFPGGGGTQRLPRNISLCRAKEMVFLGKPISAATALEWGLLNRVVPKSELMPTALKLARKLAQQPSFALKMAKLCLDATQSCDLQTGLELESASWSMLFGTADQKEGMEAFINKRKPVYNK